MFEISSLWRFLQSHTYLLTAVFLGVGLVECFFGRRMLKPTLFIVG